MPRPIEAFEEYIDGTPYGTVEVKFYRHAGRTTGMEVKAAHATKFDANKEALAYLLGFIGKQSDDLYTGSHTLELTFHEGQLKRLHQHINARIDPTG